jgi:hypothetical protein
MGGNNALRGEPDLAREERSHSETARVSRTIPRPCKRAVGFVKQLISVDEIRRLKDQEDQTK